MHFTEHKGPTGRDASRDQESAVVSGLSDRDNANLTRLGKKAVLRRTFSTLPLLGFSCTILATWEGLLSTFIIPLQNGGSAGVVYSFIFAWIGTGSCFVILSEMASMAPTSGGQYHWCAMLAPQQSMKFLSYITGWVTLIGWQAAFASFAYLTGTEIQGVAIMAYPEYQCVAWHGTLILWAVVLFGLVPNIVGGRFLPRLESCLLVLHIGGFIAILVPMTVLSASHTRTSKEVFSEFLNGGGFPSQGLSWLIGMTGCVFAFAGGDAAVHMAEEVQNAPVVIPRAILFSVCINGALGFGMLVATLFCMRNIDEALDTPTGYPFIEIFRQASGSKAGAVGMTSILLVISIFGVVGLLAATSRQFWSFARDRGVPLWRLWSHVTHSTALPVYSILATMTISCLLGLINIGSSVALNDILSMSVSGLYSSYLTVGALLLYRRCSGHILPFDANDETLRNVPGAKLMWGPFRIPGLWGIAVNAFAVMYMILVVFFSFWPTQMHVKVDTMNYSVVGTVGTILLATFYYIVRARKVYEGPVVEFRR